MDKYTVDLDKVLNDFEYSELTDTFGSSRAFLAQGASSYASSSKSRTGDAKHSITNVFHSLNEYLNTDISSNPKRSDADSNKENVEQNVTYLGNVQSHPNKEAEVRTENLLDLSFSEEFPVNFHPEDSSSEDIVEELPPVIEEGNLEIEGQDLFGNSKEIPKSETLKEEPNALEVGNSTLNNSLGDLEVKEKDLFVINEEIPKCEVVKEEPKIVKYDDTLEIDDSTLNKFLDDLEVEVDAENFQADEIESEEIKQREDATEIVEEIISEVIERCENVNLDSVERPNVLVFADGSEEDSKKRAINLIGDPGSTPYNNLYISKELSTENATALKEKESSASPTFSEASTDTISDSSDAETDPHNPIEPSVAQTESAAKLTEEIPAPPAENDPAYWLGKQAPLWIPDSEALSCLHCDTRFTVIKRRHHCRACGLVLCSKCCNLKYRLEYLDAEARVCLKCYGILNRDSSSSEVSPTAGNSPSRQPNPNNPMEYCSVVPPLQQVGNARQNPPTVMVPVGVLKRKGSNKKSNKSVMFYDGIRPGSDLTKLDTDFDAPSTDNRNTVKNKGDEPKVYSETLSFVPKNSTELPPLVTVCKSETTYICNKYKNDENLLELLKSEKLTFAVQKNIFVHVKIIDLSCCINKTAWCFSTEGFLSVGQDEIVYLLEFSENETCVPIDIFNHLNIIYNDALKGTTVSELGLSLHDSSTFLDFKNHAGFLYIRPTFQCIQNIIKPAESYLIGLLIHRWETPWAKIFPLRLMLRLGAEYRYYPCPLISTRYRDSLFVELGHTIMSIFADFRNFSYTLPNIRGLTVHMEDKNTTVSVPSNRYDQVMSSLSNSSDHILVFGGNFSAQADSHLVCIQDTQSSTENAYTTHAINIQNRPRKVTGASFIVFNGALKSTSGLTAKSSIVEDGLMIQILPEDMTALRDSLRNMRNYVIKCGCVNSPSDETVNIVWGEPDANFNIGVASPIDGQSLSGVPSIRIHNGKNYPSGPGHSKVIRWTEVFILESGEERSKARDPMDVSKVSESVAKATCAALAKYLDLLCGNSFFKIGIRATLHVENVSYAAGGNGVKLPPIYMKSLDNELVPVLHRIVSNNPGDDAVTLELIFRILNS